MNMAYTEPQVETLVERLRTVDGGVDGIAAEAASTIERLLEDRASFPDRPDWVGKMIMAHIRNKDAVVRSHEDACRRSCYEVRRLRNALERIASDCTARKAVKIAKAALGTEAR